METKRLVALAACVALLVGTVMLAAPGQDRPGLPTRGQMWIENRGRDEAIPVVVQEPVPVIVQSSSTMPIPVQLAGTLAGSTPPIVATRVALQAWEYQTIGVPRDATPQGLTMALAAPGLAGWEPAGVQVVAGTTTLLVMKRPLQDARPNAR